MMDSDDSARKRHEDARKGGIARSAAMTPEERSASASRAAIAKASLTRSMGHYPLRGSDSKRIAWSLKNLTLLAEIARATGNEAEARKVLAVMATFERLKILAASYEAKPADAAEVPEDALSPAVREHLRRIHTEHKNGGSRPAS